MTIRAAFRVCVFFLIATTASFSSLCAEETGDRTVLLSILARNKAHVLPDFLSCIDALDYDKQKIVVYINTNNNQDNTAQLLEDWIASKGNAYRDIIYENHEVETLSACAPHEWSPARFKVLGAIRNRSMNMAIEINSDFYFVVDCDNFIIPSTLRNLVSHDKPIIAPMLRAIPNENDCYSNFFSGVDSAGYYADTGEYFPILYWQKTGVFEVPVAHCTYLVQTRYIPELTYIDGTDDYEFVIFSRRARERGIGQFICNEEHFGYVLHPTDDISLQEEAELVKTLDLSWITVPRHH